ncbi:MAG: hypothetical protein AAGH87_06710 [Pseudomonadota bacterium]
MNSLVILCGGVLIALVHLLGAAAPGSARRGLVVFALSLIASTLAIRALVDGAGLGRTTDFDRVVNHAVATAAADPEAPLLVLTGASYSRNALDDARFTEALRSRGYAHRVISLSLEAATLPERETHLDVFMRRSGRVPDVVLVEAAFAFDLWPARFFNNSKFSARAIEQFDPRTSARIGLGILGGGCPGAAGCAKDAALTAAHFLAHSANLGLVSAAENPARVGALAAYDPQTVPRRPVGTRARIEGLSAAPHLDAQAGPRWIAGLRAQLDARLRGAGVRRLGIYFPPVIDGHARAYVDALCRGEFAGRPCFAPTDPALLEALKGDVWLDPAHLLAPGAEVYTDWLAEALDHSGVLGPSVDTVGPQAAR